MERMSLHKQIPVRESYKGQLVAWLSLVLAVVAIGLWGFYPSSGQKSLLDGQSSTNGSAFEHVANTKTPTLANIFGNNPNMIADVAETVAPSVVNIDVARTERVQQRYPGMGRLEDEIFRRFFGLPNAGGRQAQPERVVTGNGSGVIIDDQGHIVTNNHVVNNADEMVVTLNDGRKVNAKLVGVDKYTDLAVLKIDADNIKYSAFGDSEALRPGEFVLAIGSPLGFDHTVTLGIVSAISRRVPDINMNLEFIQTDAAINPGNSGGPLVNLNGEVIGINTAISGVAQNIGFAIPVNVVKDVAKTLIEDGSVVRPWIGIAMTPLNPDLARSLGLSERTEGIVVAQVVPDSPADEAGFLSGDIVQRMNGEKVTSAKSVQQLVQQMPVGSEVTFQVLRDSQMRVVKLKSRQLPDAYSAQRR